MIRKTRVNPHIDPEAFVLKDWVLKLPLSSIKYVISYLEAVYARHGMGQMSYDKLTAMTIEVLATPQTQIERKEDLSNKPLKSVEIDWIRCLAAYNPSENITIKDSEYKLFKKVCLIIFNNHPDITIRMLYSSLMDMNYNDVKISTTLDPLVQECVDVLVKELGVNILTLTNPLYGKFSIEIEEERYEAGVRLFVVEGDGTEHYIELIARSSSDEAHTYADLFIEELNKLGESSIFLSRITTEEVCTLESLNGMVNLTADTNSRYKNLILLILAYFNDANTLRIIPSFNLQSKSVETEKTPPTKEKNIGRL